MKYKNYYEILGVTRRTQREDIKIAYRKLAKKFHPDANKNDNDAESMFKDINEAYDTLTNEEKRKKYDRHVLKYRYGFDPNETSLPNIKYEIKSGMGVFNDILSTILGFKRDDDGQNFGDIDNEPEETKAKQKPERGVDIETNLEITLEEGFFGTEKKIAIKGYKGGLKTFSVNVPIGIRDGDKIRLAALGLPGKNGGKNGDLIINVKIKNEENIELKGMDFIHKIYVSPALAALGGKYKLQIMNETIFVDLPKHLKNNQKVIVEKKGYSTESGKRGELILEIKIEMPENISEREEKLYEQLLKLENRKQKTEK